MTCIQPDPDAVLVLASGMRMAIGMLIVATVALLCYVIDVTITGRGGPR